MRSSVGEGGEIVYGRRPVAEAKRGRRRVRRVWTGDDASAEELTQLAGSPDHQGVVAEVDPYPYADPTSLLGDPEALVVALDQVQDPRNLGAVCRSAEAAGAAGLVMPSRAARRRSPRRPCKASAGAVEHLAVARVTNLADWLARGQGRGRLDLRRRGRRAEAHTQADLTGKVVLVLGSEGKGLRPRWRRPATCCSRSRCGGGWRR